MLLFGRANEPCITSFILPDPVEDTITIACPNVESPKGPLTASTELLDVLRTHAREQFALTLIAHCAPRFPKTFERIEDTQKSVFMLAGIETAKQFNITKRGPVTSFMEMRLVLGVGVSDDPMCPWVADILTQVSPENQMAATEALVSRFSDYNLQMNGEKNSIFFAALERTIGAMSFGKQRCGAAALTLLGAHEWRFIASLKKRSQRRLI